jgi:L-asparaginase
MNNILPAKKRVSPLKPYIKIKIASNAGCSAATAFWYNNIRFASQINTMAIRIFVTGGTFDKEYNEITGQLFFKETHLPEMISRSRVTPEVNVTTLMMIDSLDMNAQERIMIANQCNSAAENQIIITHGTDTMAVTAAVLAESVKNKTIVLTGAMIPYKFGSSDGFFNLGCALAFVQSLPVGVYVAMNGRYFNWNNVKKNRSTGQFEEVLQTAAFVPES